MPLLAITTLNVLLVVFGGLGAGALTLLLDRFGPKDNTYQIQEENFDNDSD